MAMSPEVLIFLCSLGFTGAAYLVVAVVGVTRGPKKSKAQPSAQKQTTDKEPGAVIAEAQIAVSILSGAWYAPEQLALQDKCLACIELMKALYRFDKAVGSSAEEVMVAAALGDKIFADIDTSGFAPALARRFEKGKRIKERMRAAKVLIEEIYGYLVAMGIMGLDYPPAEHIAALDKFLARGGKILDPSQAKVTMETAAPPERVSLTSDIDPTQQPPTAKRELA